MLLRRKFFPRAQRDRLLDWSGGRPGMPYVRQNGEKCGLALVRQGEK